jgi:hypothetical protein
MTKSTLPITRLVNVSVNLAPNAAQIQNINTLMILGTSTVIDIIERYRVYSSISQVASDFGTSAEEYLTAVLWFEQQPQPTSLLIGRWAKTSTAGKLIGGAVSAANQLITAWTGITTGSLKVSTDGVLRTLTGMSFAAQTNLNGVASVIQTALRAASSLTETVVWNSTFQRFEITSATTGASSTISFLTAAGSGVDISGMLAGLSTSSGAYVANGIVSESALEAATLFDNNYGQTWYGLQIPAASDSDHQAVGSFVEAATSKHTYWVSTTASGVISSASTTDIAYLMKQLSLNRSMVQYSSTNAYASASLAAKALTIDYNGNNTVIDLMYKQEPGITAENLNTTQITALEAKNANVFLAYNNDTAIIEKGNATSGVPIDIITGTDWLSLVVQTEVYNLLYLSATKIPQTDAGNHMILTTIESVLSQAVANGLLAPGVWTSGGFGALSTGDYMPKGFYVYAPPIVTQLSADRSARKSVTFQIAAKLAGAIRTVDIIINVNR